VLSLVIWNMCSYAGGYGVLVADRTLIEQVG